MNIVDIVQFVLEEFVRCSVVEPASGQAVDLVGNQEQVVGRIGLKRRALGEKTPEQTVVPFVLTSLTGTVRMRKIHTRVPQASKSLGSPNSVPLSAVTLANTSAKRDAYSS